jgi:hypothetical protein
LALTSAPFDSGSRTLSVWLIAGLSVAQSDLLLAFGPAPWSSITHVRFAAKSGNASETFFEPGLFG